MRWVQIVSTDLVAGDAIALDYGDVRNGPARVSARVLEAEEVGVEFELVAVREGKIRNFKPFTVTYRLHPHLDGCRLAYAPSESPADRDRRRPARHEDPYRWMRARIVEAAGGDIDRLAAVIDPIGNPVGESGARRVMHSGLPWGRTYEWMLRGLRALSETHQPH